MYRSTIITVSDRSFRGERQDLSGPEIERILGEAGFDVANMIVVPDEASDIERILRNAVTEGIHLVLTTGGTGFAPRDITPEASLRVIERRADGLSEAMRHASLLKTPYAVLSRGVCGIAGGTLIVNLPGSPKGARESIEAILPVLRHALALLNDQETEHVAPHPGDTPS